MFSKWLGVKRIHLIGIIELYKNQVSWVEKIPRRNHFFSKTEVNILYILQNVLISATNDINFSVPQKAHTSET